MPVATKSDRRPVLCQLSIERLDLSGRDVRAPGARASRPLCILAIHHSMPDRVPGGVCLNTADFVSGKALAAGFGASANQTSADEVSVEAGASFSIVSAINCMEPIKTTVNPMSPVNVPRANGTALIKQVVSPASVCGYKYWPASCGMHHTPRLLIRKKTVAASSPVPNAAGMCFG